MKPDIFFIYIIYFIFLSGCATDGSRSSGRSGLELQAFQKKEFNCSKKIAFSSTLSVFQDFGFSVKSASFETGHFSASGVPPVPNARTLHSKAFDFYFGSLPCEVTVTVEPISSNRTSIRMNFTQLIINQSRQIEMYKMVFSKIEETAFIKVNH